jgi:chaperone modulatory protein CbpM
MSMDSNTVEAVWLNESTTCTLLHLAEVSGLSSAELQSLVDTGALTPVGMEQGGPAFEARYVVVARTARRLRDDFELDPAGLALAMRLLARIDAMERELDSLRARLPRP